MSESKQQEERKMKDDQYICGALYALGESYPTDAVLEYAYNIFTSKEWELSKEVQDELNEWMTWYSSR